MRDNMNARLRSTMVYHPLSQESDGTELARFRLLADHVLIEPLGIVPGRFEGRVGSFIRARQAERGARVFAVPPRGYVVKVGPH